MRKLALFSLVAATAAVTFSDPKPKFSFIFSLKGHRMTELAATRDGRRLYYVQDTSDLFMYDRSTRKTTRLLGDMIGPRSDIALSAAGDRLAFCRNGEEGDGPHLWIVSLDPKTGLLNGAPHRVSSLKATDPSFSPDGRSIAFGARTSAAGTENLVVVPANGGPERVLAEGLPPRS